MFSFNNVNKLLKALRQVTFIQVSVKTLHFKSQVSNTLSNWYKNSFATVLHEVMNAIL